MEGPAGPTASGHGLPRGNGINKSEPTTDVSGAVSDASSTTTYAYRLKAKTAVGSLIAAPNGSDGLVEIDVGYALNVRLPTDNESRPEIILLGRGFPSSEAAWDAGERARWALRVAALRADFAVDLGIARDRRDRPDTAIADWVRNSLLTEHGVRVLNDVHGLQVVPEDAPLQVARAGPIGLTVTSPSDRLLDPLVATLSAPRAPRQDRRAALAIDLYFLARFESSVRSKVLALVTVLEVLADKAQRPAEVLEHLEDLKDRTKAARVAAENDETRRAFERFMSELRKLRDGSVGEAIRTLVRQHTSSDATYDDEAADQFATRCYLVRSEMVHAGEEGEDVVLPTLHNELNRLVKDVLLDVTVTAS